MKRQLLYLAAVLASASVGILFLLMSVYLPWIEGESADVFQFFSLEISVPTVLIFLVFVEVLIALSLLLVVRKIGKR